MEHVKEAAKTRFPSDCYWQNKKEIRIKNLSSRYDVVDLEVLAHYITALDPIGISRINISSVNPRTFAEVIGDHQTNGLIH